MSGRPAGRRRRAIGATAIAVSCVILSACGAHSHRQRASVTRTVTRTVTVGSATNPISANEVLSLSGLGTFEGRCPRGASSWTLRFVVTAGASDAVSFAVGKAAPRTVEIQPGRALTIHLVPYAVRTHEPPDRFFPPIGQGRGVATAVSVPTTAPLHARIYQGTEPQELRADVDLALSAIGGESGQCILVGSTVHAYTYPNGV